jgi:Amt family ammonium transporter
MSRGIFGALLAALLLLSAPAIAAEPRPADTGDTAFMLLSSVLVLLMTVPGLALFYGGMVRKKNILATMMQSFFLTALITVVWVVLGYSLAFGNGGGLIGDLSRVMLGGMEIDFDKAFTLGAGTGSEVQLTIPESVFMLYQMTFAIITPAVVTGAFADRMKFSALILLMVLWSLFVYAPIAHWAWAPLGWLNQLGMADFAGGTVVEINSGIAGLVCALVLGRRLGLGHDNMAPHNLAYAVIGASLLWVGWLGFNGGSALASGGRAGMAIVATQIAAAAATLSWTAIEWIQHRRPTVLGAISGAVAGMVAITPAAGFVLPGAALLIGLAAGVVCYFAVTVLKARLRYDDSLDAFGVHGVGGILGMLATGIFAAGLLSATEAAPEGAYQGGLALLGVQALGVAAAAAWSGAGTFLLLKLTDALIGLRVGQDEERQGLDEALHGESLG